MPEQRVLSNGFACSFLGTAFIIAKYVMTLIRYDLITQAGFSRVDVDPLFLSKPRLVTFNPPVINLELFLAVKPSRLISISVPAAIRRH